MTDLFDIWHSKQTRLFPWLEERLDPLSDKEKHAFAEYSCGCLPQKIHEAMVKAHVKEKLVGHVSRDATAIEAREKVVKKQTEEKAGSRGARYFLFAQKESNR